MPLNAMGAIHSPHQRADGLDILDNTPLLDIKPYVPAFDAFEAKRIGWCGHAQGGSVTADNRFEAGKGTNSV